MAGRPTTSRVLDVWMNGELVGAWTLQGQGHRFSYADTWFASPYARSLSLSLPMTQGTAPFTDARVENYFDNLLPDSLDIRKRVALRFGASSIRAFDLIEKIGKDCVGAVQLMPGGSAPPDVRRIDATPLSDARSKACSMTSSQRQGQAVAMMKTRYAFRWQVRRRKPR
ncbi:HipA N-terminal domain-containing protein [Janthinobacterium sp. RB2R34]|uniref:HipA N-terminal domain-containing protein n=1 Tax=Janthinobacterium sp. RB2R34 TaxID=3424193 RepID=UPI003F298B98